MKSLGGVYAAVLTPRDAEGAIDYASFSHQLAFLIHEGIDGFAINGATGEYPMTSEQELGMLLDYASRSAPGARVLCGIGATSIHGTVARGRVSIAAGADALLLPMPSFFTYDQTDLLAFVSSIADQLQAPILLYNLPQFTTGLEVDTVLQLLRHPWVVGIKDSSGDLEIVRTITRVHPDRVRLIGNDGALTAALCEGICDGVVSGVACALPEMMLSLFHSFPGSPEMEQAQALLADFIAAIGRLPTPWGLKVASASRGITQENFPFPCSPLRSVSIQELQRWFAEWLPSALSHLAVNKAAAQGGIMS